MAACPNGMTARCARGDDGLPVFSPRTSMAEFIPPGTRWFDLPTPFPMKPGGAAAPPPLGE